MDWTAQVDGYCERLGAGFWAEPANALTNLAFVLVALWLWPRMRGWPMARALCAVLMAIGVGSFLFHTLATAWAGLADVLPIAAFVVLYIYVANRAYWGQGPWLAVGSTLVGFGAIALVAAGLGALGGPLGANGPYIGVCALIAAYGLALLHRHPSTAKRLLIGAGLLAVSLCARMLDGPLCATNPLGSHFLWHLLNAAMLGWMIESYRRHMLEGARAAR